MLARMNIGTLILYDYDSVEMANMNRLFFTALQVGMNKVEAAKETLHLVNPMLKIETRNIDVTSINGYS